MTKDEIIEMAKQAGAIPIHEKPKDVALVGIENIERFAKLVTAAAASKEREACAMVVEDVEQSPNPIINITNRLAAAAIRARGQQ